MLLCPRCRADLSQRAASERRCPECGIFLSEDKLRQATAVAGDQGTGSEMAADVVKQMPRPRELSPAYERHLHERIQATYALAERPSRETMKSDASQAKKGRSHLHPWSVVITGELGSGSSPADYELAEKIGEGGMGNVWSARQVSLDREVAVKVPHPPHVDLDEGSKRKLQEKITNQFMSEVLVTGKLEHPNIVSIYDLGADEKGNPLYSMKRLRGGPWAELIEGEHYEEQRNIEILMKVCDAIAFAHHVGFLHLDLKPENIWVGEYGEVSVFDWGVAVQFKKKEAESELIQEGILGFTPAYAAPEMVIGKHAGPATDIYLLGAILYELVTGVAPHRWSGDASEDAMKAARNEILPVSAEVSGELLGIALRAMETEPGDRYRSVQVLQEALRDYQSHTESLKLSARARAFTERAEQSRKYEDFQGAVGGFQNALDLWNRNQEAAEGLSQARLAYARCARRAEDFNLGLDLLDEHDPNHQAEMVQLRKAKRASDQRATRLRRARQLMIGGGLAFTLAISVLAVVLGFALESARIARGAAVAAQENAEKQTEFAVKNRDEANRQTTIAINEKERADTQKGIAEKNAGEANRQKTIAIDEKARAVASAYASEVGMAQSELDRNAFLITKQILERQDDEPDESSNSKRKLRHWEWGHLNHSVYYKALEELPWSGARQRYEAVAMTPDLSKGRRWIVAGTTDGELRSWRRDTNTERWRSVTPVKHGLNVFAVAISHDGLFVASVGRDSDLDKPYSLKIWRLPEGDDDQLKQPRAVERRNYGNRFLDVAFSADSYRLVTAASESKSKSESESHGHRGVAETWSFIEGRRLVAGSLLLGHTGVVNSARFSPDGKWVVTASEDWSVRIWSLETKKVLRRFNHDGPVFTAEFAPDGTYIVSGGQDRRVVLWKNMPKDGDPDFEEDYRKKIEDQSKTAEPLAVEQEGKTVLGEHDAEIRSVSIGTGGLVFSAARDNTVRVWDEAGKKAPKTLRGHGGWVESCVSSLDGQQVLSGGYDGVLRLWNWQSYQLPEVLARTDDQRSPLVWSDYSPDGKWIVAVYEDGAIKVWDLRDRGNPQPQRLDQGHDYLTTTAILFQDGQRLMTAAGDNSVRVWNADSGAHLFKLGAEAAARHGTGFRGVAAISPDEQWIVTGSDKPDVPGRLWNVGTHKWTENLELIVANQATAAAVTTIAFNPLTPQMPDSEQLVLLGDDQGRCYLVDIPSGVVRHHGFGHSRKVSRAAFLPDGSFVTASTDGTLTHWHITPNGVESVPKKPMAHGGAVVSLAISPSGKLAVTGVASDAAGVVVQLWDLDSGSELQKLTLAQLVKEIRPAQARRAATSTDERQVTVRSVDISASGSEVLITAFDPTPQDEQHYSVVEWTIATEELRKRFRAQALSSALYRRTQQAGREEEFLLVGATGARRVSRQDPPTVQDFRRQPAARFASFSPDNNRLLVAGGDGSLYVWTLNAAGKWQHQISAASVHQHGIRFAFFDPLRPTDILSVGDDGEVRISKLADDASSLQSTTVPTPRAAVFCAAFSPDGERVVVTSEEDDAVVCQVIRKDGSVERLEELAELEAGEAMSRYAVFSADGALVVTANGKQAGVWDAKEGTLLGRTQEHSASVNSVALSHDALRILTASEDGLVKVLDARGVLNGSQGSIPQLISLEHDGPVNSVAFSPNGQDVLTGGDSGMAVIWPGIRVAPSISLEKTEVQYTIGDDAIKIAPGANVITPTKVSFSGAKLFVTMDEDKTTDEDKHGLGLDGNPLPENGYPLNDRRDVESTLAKITYQRLNKEDGLPDADPAEVVISVTIRIKGLKYIDSPEVVPDIKETITIRLSTGADSVPSDDDITKVQPPAALSNSPASLIPVSR